MHLSPLLLTYLGAPGNRRSCVKMWHRPLWPKNTDWSHSNSTLKVVINVHVCPHAAGAPLGEMDRIIVWTLNPAWNLFQEVQWERKWKQRVFIVTFPQLGDLADSEIYFLLAFTGHHSTDFSAVLSIYISRDVPEIYTDNPSFSQL